MTIRALLFDKDGTLFGFHATWGGWAKALLERLAGDVPERAETLAEAIRFDLPAARFHRDSPAIAGTETEVVSLLLPHLPEWTAETLVADLARSAAAIEPVPAVPLGPLLSALRGSGVLLGVATNDGEASARSQLERCGVAGQFDAIYGYDSGFGAKPGPGPCLAFAEAMDLDPREIAMIGDSTHDLLAGRAAGMRTIGVLTGPALTEDLEPHADAVLPDIGHLPQWLSQSRASGRASDLGS